MSVGAFRGVVSIPGQFRGGDLPHVQPKQNRYCLQQKFFFVNLVPVRTCLNLLL